MFARYAAIVKNLRGVVLFDLNEEGVTDSIKWLVKRFRYRDLGLVPSVLARYRDILQPYLNGNPFRELVYPVPELEALTSCFEQCLNVPRAVAELLVFSSTYISPGIVVGSRYIEYIKRLAQTTVYACKEMDTNSWKLHLRIADYTVLDSYERAVIESLEILLAESEQLKHVNTVLEERNKRILEDTKRYWRLKCTEGEQPIRPFLFYIDNLRLFANCGFKPRKPNYAAALAIIDVVYIPSGLS